MHCHGCRLRSCDQRSYLAVRSGGPRSAWKPVHAQPCWLPVELLFVCLITCDSRIAVVCSWLRHAVLASACIRWFPLTLCYPRACRCCTAQVLALLHLEAELTGGESRCNVDMVPSTATGEIVCTYTAPKSGMYRLQLTAANPERGGARVHIASSPHSLQVTVMHIPCGSHC